MTEPRSFTKRPFLVMLALALFALAGISFNRIVRFQREFAHQQESQLEAQIEDLVAAWEEQLVDELNQWMETAGSDPATASRLQGQLRRRVPWLDSLYLWVPPREIAVRGERQMIRGTLLYPTYPPSEDTEAVLSRACLSRARILTLNPLADPMQVANAYIQGCRNEDTPVRLVAATEAATLLARIGRFDTALDALESSGVSPSTPIQAGIEEGIAPFRLVVGRTQRAQLLLRIGRSEEALDLLYDTGQEVTALDAPEAAGVLQYVRWPIIAELRQHGRQDAARRLEIALSRAERRERAFREIAERILPRSPPQASEAPRFIYDQYEETPFLLYYGPIRGGEMGAALSLDQPKLLSDFLGSMRRYKRFVTLTDASGAYVAGVPGGQDDVVMTVPFSRTLTHLRVKVHQGAVDEQMARLTDPGLAPMIATIFVVVLGLLAILQQDRTNRNQENLLVRQREFTTRVTHELKTPLAGIRVMGENLESGAWRDPNHRREMAQRIVEEADRLAQRVDEILAVAREPSVPNPELFDPEEVALEVIDQWGPRLEQAGIQLHADLHPTPEVKGDTRAVRDAVSCLLDNALKYSDDKRPDRQVWFTLRDEGRWVVIDVADNGIGVPRNKRREIFERFVRVEGPHRGKAGGHGLGLAQVARIAAAHKGKVECVEGIDGGARFVLRLPAVG